MGQVKVVEIDFDLGWQRCGNQKPNNQQSMHVLFYYDVTGVEPG